MKLIHISDRQGQICWTQVRDADAAIIRFSQGSDADCCIGIAPETDEYADANLRGCYAAQIACGVSHLLGGITVSEVRRECAWLIRALRQSAQYHTLPVVVIELGDGGISPKYRALSPAHNAQLIRTAAALLRRAGFTPVFFADREMLDEYIDRRKLGRIGLWYSRPFVSAAAARAEEPDMLFWQYSAETSPRNAGISADYPVSRTEAFRFEPLQPRIRCHTVGIGTAPAADRGLLGGPQFFRVAGSF